MATVDVQTRTEDRTGIPVNRVLARLAATPDRKTAFVAPSGTVSMVDVKTRTKHPRPVAVRTHPTVGQVPGR